jgi:hypothetical protein
MYSEGVIDDCGKRCVIEAVTLWEVGTALKPILRANPAVAEALEHFVNAWERIPEDVMRSGPRALWAGGIAAGPAIKRAMFRVLEDSVGRIGSRERLRETIRATEYLLGQLRRW